MREGIRRLLVAIALTVQGASFVVAQGCGEEEHEVPQHAVEIARPFGFPITNSRVVTWVVAILLIIFVRAARRDMKRTTEGAQNFLEWMVESLYSFLEGIMGKHLVKRTFWCFATISIFILAANWFGLIPGVGTIGWGHEVVNDLRVEDPLLRANADLKLTLAMAFVFFALWVIWAMQEVGPQPDGWRSFRFSFVPYRSAFDFAEIHSRARTCSNHVYALARPPAQLNVKRRQRR